MKVRVRILGLGDEDHLEAYLSKHQATTMFLRSNLQIAGVVDQGQVFGATWMATLENNEITGVIAFCSDGVILLQSGKHTSILTEAAMDLVPRLVEGLVGPWGMTTIALATLELNPKYQDQIAFQLKSHEDLFFLHLDKLQIPDLLQSKIASCQQATQEHLPLLTQWSAEFGLATMNEVDNPEFRKRCHDSIIYSAARGELWQLMVKGQPVACCHFSANLPDCVQIGGVWTPPSARGQGYGRSVVAGSLLAAKEQGVMASVLFTAKDNIPARRAYKSLGYQWIGDYGILLF